MTKEAVTEHQAGTASRFPTWCVGLVIACTMVSAVCLLWSVSLPAVAVVPLLAGLLLGLVALGFLIATLRTAGDWARRLAAGTVIVAGLTVLVLYSADAPIRWRFDLSKDALEAFLEGEIPASLGGGVAESISSGENIGLYAVQRLTRSGEGRLGVALSPYWKLPGGDNWFLVRVETPEQLVQYAARNSMRLDAHWYFLYVF